MNLKDNVRRVYYVRADGSRLPDGCRVVTVRMLDKPEEPESWQVFGPDGVEIRFVFVVVEGTCAICAQSFVDAAYPIGGYHTMYAALAGKCPVAVSRDIVELQQVVTQRRVKVCGPCARKWPISVIAEPVPREEPTCG